MRSRRGRLTWLLLFALSACAEGGSRGSGISTLLAGNVVSVQPGGSPLASIRVGIEGKRAHGTTDASGAFRLQGSFEGMIGVLFTVPGTAGSAQLLSNVPANGQLTLTDVSIDTATGEASAVTQGIEFDAIFVSVDCTEQVATVISSSDTPNDADQYLLRLDTSTVVDAQGHPIPCARLAAGDTASVDGTVNPDFSFGNAMVVVGG